MIHPDMDTMLGFQTTDAAVEASFLSEALRLAVDKSFNMVSVDGDTSTNDSVFLLASGAAGGAVIKQGTARAALFQRTLEAVCIHLARAVARDGEGDTRLITATVRGAKTRPTPGSRRAPSSPRRWSRRPCTCRPQLGARDCRRRAQRSGAGGKKLELAMCGVPVLKDGQPLPFDRDRLPYSKRKKSRLGSTSI